MNSQLKEFKRRRRIATGAIGLATFEQSLLLGSSVIAGSLIEQFTPDDEGNTYKFHGLYALSMSMFVSFYIGSEIIIPVFTVHPEWRKRWTTACVLLLPLGFVLSGAAVTANYSIALLYIGLAGVFGISLSVYDVFCRFEILQWWGPDGNKRIGVALMGLIAGIGAIFYTLFSGWIIVYVSLEVCLYAIAGLQMPLSALVAYSVLGGRLDSPPTEEQVQKWLLEEEEESRDNSDTLDEVPTIDSDTGIEEAIGEENTIDVEKGATVESNNGDNKPVPPGTTHLVPVVLPNRLEALRYPAVLLLLFQLGAQTFNGYATKVLLSSMFELVFSLPKIAAVYLSALSLTLFVAARAAVPYYLLDSRYSSTKIALVAALTSSVGYVVLPTIVGKGVYEPVFSWRLFGFVCVKSLIGGCFATLSTMSGAMCYDLVGGANLKVIFQLGWNVTGVTGTMGPIVAFITTMSRYYSGQNFSEAFSLFFYIAAGVALLNSLVISIIHRMLHRKQT